MYIAIAPKDVFAAVGSACRRPAQLQRLDLKARSSKRFSKAIVFEARYGGFGAQKKLDSPEPPRVSCTLAVRRACHCSELNKNLFQDCGGGCMYAEISCSLVW